MGGDLAGVVSKHPGLAVHKGHGERQGFCKATLSSRVFPGSALRAKKPCPEIPTEPKQTSQENYVFLQAPVTEAVAKSAGRVLTAAARAAGAEW